jgi:predicted alpha/beta hydrolase family esterase
MRPKATILVVHAYGGSPNKFWYPRLQEHVGDLAEVEVIRMTQPGTPCIAVWLDDLSRRVSKLAAAAAVAALSGQQLLLYLVGHSIGCQTIIRFLAQPGAREMLCCGGDSVVADSGPLRLAGCLLVAAWFEVVDPWEGMLPWCHTPIDCAAARATLAASAERADGENSPLVVLLSDNDRYTPDTDANAARWRDCLGASVRVLHGRAHFGSKNQPDVMLAATELLQGPTVATNALQLC